MQKIAINFTYLNELLLPLSKKKKDKIKSTRELQSYQTRYTTRLTQWNE